MIELRDVSKRYPASGRPALDRVSATVGAGEFVFLIGPSGSGKSTLLRLLLREDVPTSGSILIDGLDVAGLPRRKVPKLRQRIGCVFQDFRLLPKRTVAGNVAFALEVLGRTPSEIRIAVPELLEMVGLQGKAERLPHELSGGEQQRVAIARASVNRPPLLLADEPTGNLDPATSEMVFELLAGLARTEGLGALVATHNLELAARMDRVLRLDGGRVVEG